MANDRRIKRLETQILQTVAPAIAHGLADPRLSMVTVTRIRLSRDLSVARVNWSCMGSDGDRSKAQHALEQARGFLQSEVAAAMRTRTTPRLEFHYDEGLANAVRVNQILGDLARERAERDGVEFDEDGNPLPPGDDAELADEGAEPGDRDPE